MNDPQIRTAIAVCDGDDPLEWMSQVEDPNIGYAATLRALLEARELLRDAMEWMGYQPSTPERMSALLAAREKLRAFLAEGESK